MLYLKRKEKMQLRKDEKSKIYMNNKKKKKKKSKRKKGGKQVKYKAVSISINDFQPA